MSNSVLTIGIADSVQRVTPPVQRKTRGLRLGAVAATPDAVEPEPEAPMPYVTIPADLPPERDPGVVDVTPETLADRATVAHIREWKKNRDRNETPRTGGDEPEAA